MTPNRDTQGFRLEEFPFYCDKGDNITMMSEMGANQPAYGAYEAQQRNSAQPTPPYETGYQQPPPGGVVIDDNFIEAVSQRLAQQMAQQSQQYGGKIYSQRRHPALPAGLRGAIAIVSVVALIPIAITLGVVGGFFGLVALGLTTAVILGVNAIANGVLSPRD